MLVNHFLSEAARRRPEKVALVCAGQRVTYADLYSRSCRLASSLRAGGVRKGDRVVIQLENSVEAVVSIFGVLEAGATFVFVNATTKSEKLAFIVKDCAAAALVADGRSTGSETLTRLPRLPLAVLVNQTEDAAGGPASILGFDDAVAGAGDEVPGLVPISLDLAAIIYTSGSTGIPKGVMLSHDNILSAATSITQYLGTCETDVILNVLPLSFDYGLYQVLMACRVGATLVLERSFAYPPVILDVLVRERVTGFPIVPTIAALVVRQDLSAYQLESLRFITSTGAPLPAAHIAQLRSALPHVKLYSMYGITESKRVSYLSPDEIDARPDSVGKPMANVEVFVADEDGALHAEGTGELVVRGSNVMQGYWARPEDTAQVLRPGLLPGERVLFTGDIFRIDEKGYLYFVARKDDIIKSRGEKVSPKEVENVLCELAAVVEAAVVGVPDPILGHAVKACVTLAAGAQMSEQDIIRHCSQRLEDFMVPRLVEFVPQLPRTGSGKISRSELTARDAR